MLSDLSTALLKDIRQLFEDADDYNVTIQVGEEPNIEIFNAHSVILRARSSYFRVALSTKWAKKKGDIFTYKKPNISPKIFKEILKYIYTGTINLLDKEQQGELLKLLVAADELELEELVEHIQEHIITNESEWLKKNIVHVQQTASKHKACGRLQAYCEKNISEDASLIFQSDDFTLIEETSLIALLKRDDLDMDEIDVWDHVIRWGMAQNPNLLSDVKTWSKEDFNLMEQTLKGCMPHIRFFHISSADYFYKVRPFKKLLPSDLKENLKEHFMVPGVEPKFVVLPPRKSKNSKNDKLPGSNIISCQHASLISSWIDRNDFNYNNDSFKTSEIPYEFNLLTRGFRDSFTRQEFHDKCNNQGPTLVLLKVCGTGQIIGGYNPVNWSSSGKWVSTRDSFIFSLGEGNDLKSEAILSRVKNYDQAIRDCAISYECVGFGCGDLHIIEGTSTRKDYEKDIIDVSTFIVDDYEVFQVKKKI
ncbi:hypothetical protein RclHR1_10200010 [Rhizophagus clarus]|uniref:BTB domain-containing protein n=1 Tax=Rhizophagus clarus TaxID=94130 RepID=A0A2Z6Q103_9GLOM|nr:hypothetical protein RclHR1_10200010 [Rhizophagus clarus]GES88654.1 hypothetical protein GLOIN_2v1656075 [Rhizophagus clarus]